MVSFADGTSRLGAAVGFGPLKVTVTEDQVYAHRIEVDESLNHPRGGTAHALHNAVVGKQQDYMETLARSAVTSEGSDLVRGAQDVSEAISKQYHDNAPVLYDNLRRSSHPVVTDDGAVVYDRAPEVPRLSEEQLKALRRRGIPG